jgi:hypothetical protein
VQPPAAAIVDVGPGVAEQAIPGSMGEREKIKHEDERGLGKDFTDVDEPMIVKWLKNDCERHPEMQVQNVTRRFVTSLYVRDINTRR